MRRQRVCGRVSFGQSGAVLPRWLRLLGRLVSVLPWIAVGVLIQIKDQHNDLRTQNQALLEVIDEQAAALTSMRRVVQFEGGYLPPESAENNVRADVTLDIRADTTHDRKLYDYAALLRLLLQSRGALVEPAGREPSWFNADMARNQYYILMYTYPELGRVTYVYVMHLGDRSQLTLYEGKFDAVHPLQAKDITRMFTAIATREAYLLYGSGN